VGGGPGRNLGQPVYIYVVVDIGCLILWPWGGRDAAGEGGGGRWALHWMLVGLLINHLRFLRRITRGLSVVGDDVAFGSLVPWGHVKKGRSMSPFILPPPTNGLSLANICFDVVDGGQGRIAVDIEVDIRFNIQKEVKVALTLAWRSIFALIFAFRICLPNLKGTTEYKS